MPGTTEFPAAIDAGIEVTANTAENETGKEHDANHNNTWAALLALEAKVGIDGSADAASHDKKIADLQSGKADAAHPHAAADITSGTFADARIAQSNVTQHQAALAIDWDQLTGTMPALIVSDVHTVASEAEQLALAAQQGDIAIRTDENKSYAHNGGTAGTMADWTQLRSPTDAVLSVFGRTGAVSAQSGDYTFAQLAATPTTLAGYGITDDVLDSGDIGSAVQAYNDGLHLISAAYTAGDLGATVGIYKLVAFDGGGDAGGVTMSAFVASIVGSALASDFRAGIGLGTGATANTGTSGGTVPLLNGDNTHSGTSVYTKVTDGGSAAPIVLSSSVGGRLGFVDTDAAADGKTWDIVASGTQMVIRVINDANDAAANALIITRSGLTVTAVAIATGGATRVNVTDAGAAVTGNVTVSGDLILNTNSTSTLQGRTSGSTLVDLLRLTADANNVTRFICGVDAGGFQWTNQAQSLALLSLTTTGLSAPNALSVAKAVTFTGVLSPAQITANTDNYAPTGHADAVCFRLSSDASRNLSGLAGGVTGRRITLSNVGAQPLVLAHDLTSTAANRFLCPGSVNFTLPANASVDCWYDGTSARWRVISN